MSEHIHVNEDYIAAVLKNAAWESARVDLTEVVQEETEEVIEEQAKEVHSCPLCESVLDEELSDEQISEHLSLIEAALNSLKEMKEEEEDDEVEEDRGDKKGDKGAGKDEDDAPDFTTDEREGDKSKTKKGKKDFMKKVDKMKAKAKGK